MAVDTGLKNKLVVFGKRLVRSSGKLVLGPCDVPPKPEETWTLWISVAGYRRTAPTEFAFSYFNQEGRLVSDVPAGGTIQVRSDMTLNILSCASVDCGVTALGISVRMSFLAYEGSNPQNILPGMAIIGTTIPVDFINHTVGEVPDFSAWENYSRGYKVPYAQNARGPTITLEWELKED